MSFIMSHAAIRIPFALTLLVLFWGAAFLAVLRIRNAEGRIKNIITLSVAFSSFLLIEIMIDLNKMRAGKEAVYVSRLADTLPLWSMFIILLVLTGGLILLTADHLRYRKSHISNVSIKEGIDLLEAGIAIYTHKGIPVVINPVMERIGEKAFGENPHGDEGLFKKLLSFDKDVIELGDDAFYSYRKHELMIDGVKCIEFIFDDVSEEYRTTGLLKEKNERLERMNGQLKELNATIDSFVIENEILNAKVMVHDKLGQALLATQQYLLNEGKEDAQRITELLDMWKENISFMKNNPVREDDDELIALIEAASDVGVGLIFNGAGITKASFDMIFGREGEIRHIAVTAMHECMTNTLRHAGGDEVYVNAIRDKQGVILTITNNGSNKTERVTEKGGLKSLRSMVEKYGGTMQITATDGFMLKISLPVSF